MGLGIAGLAFLRVGLDRREDSWISLIDDLPGDG